MISKRMLKKLQVETQTPEKTPKVHIAQYFSSKKRIAVVAVALIALLFMILYLSGAATVFDTFGKDLILSMRGGGVTDFFKIATQYLNPYFLAIIVVVVAAFGPGNHPGFCLTLDVVGAFFVNEILKMIFQRPRPTGFSLVSETGYSFPSGHAVLAMAFFGLLIWLVWQALRERTVWKWFLTIILSFVIFAVGFSRVFLGVHWLTDVCEGWCIGFLWLMFFVTYCAPRLQNAKLILADTAFYKMGSSPRRMYKRVQKKQAVAQKQEAAAETQKEQPHSQKQEAVAVTQKKQEVASAAQKKQGIATPAQKVEAKTVEPSAPTEDANLRSQHPQQPSKQQ